MALSKPARRMVAGIASAFLLLCQSLAMAQACVPAPAVAGESALIQPCHDAASQSGDTAGHAQQHDCPAQYASAGFSKIDVPHALDLPGLAFQPGGLAAPARDGWIALAPPARAESPPLIILHCCLRN